MRSFITARFKTRARRLLFWSILVLWTFLLAEGAAAVYFLVFSRTYYRPLYVEVRNDQWLWRTERDDWGGWHKPSSVAYHRENCYSVSYRSNSYGARDEERSPDSPAKRAVMLGDSFVEGYGVAEEQRLSNLLERRLGFDILNFGMTHFGPLQYQILYEKMVRRFAHDAVIIGFLPENDFVDNDLEFNRRSRHFRRHYRPYYSADGGVAYPRARPGPEEEPPFAALANDIPERRPPLENFKRLFWLYGLNVEVRWHVSVLLDPRPDDYVGYFESNALRISNAARSILAVAAAAAPRPVLVVFLPDYKAWSYVESHPARYERSAVARMRGELERNAIKTIDLLEEFMRRDLDKASLYLPCDGHWNAAGHHAASDVLEQPVRALLEGPDMQSLQR